MSMMLSVASVFPLAGAANAALLSAVIGWRAIERRSLPGLYGAAFLAVAALAITVITLDHAGVSGGVVLPAAEALLTLAAGPFFALFVGALLGKRANAAMMFAPLALYIVATMIIPSVLLRGPRIEALVLVQIGYTLFALAMALSAPRPTGRLGRRRRAFALMAIAALSSMHVAQLVRALSDAAWLHDIVPYVTATLFFALAGIVMFGVRTAALDPVLNADALSDQDRALVARLEAAMAAPELLRNPRLTLADVSAAAGVGAPAAARLLATAFGASFKDHITRLRVREAERLLRDPAEARTSMEAIGLLSGFGSRSAFYEAFRAHTGLSPAAYRATPPQN